MIINNCAPILGMEFNRTPSQKKKLFQAIVISYATLGRPAKEPTLDFHCKLDIGILGRRNIAVLFSLKTPMCLMFISFLFDFQQMLQALDSR